MTHTYWKLEHIPYANGTWDTDSVTEITSFYNPLLRQTLGTGKDSFNFEVVNTSAITDTKFNINDKIIVYRTTNTDTVTTNDIRMVAVIKDIPINKTNNADKYTIKCYNFSEAVSEALTFVDLETFEIPLGLKQAIDQVAGANSNFAVEWDNSNPTLKSDNVTHFPVIGERFFNKPLKTLLEKYSAPDKTEDGFYFWYINKDNKLIWFQQDSTSLHTFDESTDNYHSYTIGKDSKEVKNYIILKGGISPSGNQIGDKYIDWTSVAEHGIKYYMLISENNNAQELTKLDLAKSYGTASVNTRYPILSTLFETEWISSVNAVVDGVTMTKGSKVTINLGNETDNQKAYDAIVQTEVRSRLQAEARRFVRTRRFGKLKVDVTFQAGQESWNLGDRVSCTIGRLSAVNKELRVVDIQLSNTSDTFSLEEDEGTL